MDILNERTVPAAEARNSLRKKDEEEMTYEQKICIDFLRKNVKIPVTKAREAMEELQEVGRIKPRQAAMLINVQPEDRDDVRLVFSKERTSLSEEEMDEVLDIIEEYSK
ncbi:MAG: RNA polymerase Rpb4 family protein [Candidatus Aenigmatarchaeota archaeon]